MTIGAPELKAIEAVMSGKQSLEKAMATYSPWQRTVTAVAILHLAGETYFYRNEYGPTLRVIAAYHGIPIGKLPRDDYDYPCQPAWCEAVDVTKMVTLSRNRGLHQSQHGKGTELELTPQPALEAFCDNASYVQRAKTLLTNARKSAADFKIAYDEMFERRRQQYLRFQRALEAAGLEGVESIPHQDIADLRSKLLMVVSIIDAHFPKSR
ncbi:MAG TPA: hypothetical protein VD907_06005 [Verrucomicrobiae bacterium]|nr:hypothetical protein [Verrucomicrobiae bacterium]